MPICEGVAMPIHDWTRVDAGIFHDFHHGWIEEIKRCLNGGLLPPEYYALAEQITGRLGPDVLTLRKPGEKNRPSGAPERPIAVADRPPKVRFRTKAEEGVYAQKAKSVVIRHRSKHEIIAISEIVSPGNKGSSRTLSAFVRKAHDAMEAGIHLLIVDLFPPGSFDEQGIHPAIWEDREDEFVFSTDKPLTCVAYLADDCPEALVNPVAVGDELPDMPLFLSPEFYVSVPLEKTYQAAFNAVPAFWRDVVAGS
jgi:hypothetical protein